MYDRAMPESILNLCLENECKLCKASLKHEVMAKQHFEGKAHAKNVNLELEEIYKATGDPKPKRIDGGQKKKRSKVNHIKTPTLTDEVIAAASKPPEVDPFLQDYMDTWTRTSSCAGTLASGLSIGTDPKERSC